MSQIQSTGFCATCGEQRMFVKQRINHLLHFFLGVVTLSVWWLVVWLPLGIVNSARGDRCSVCGMKRGAPAASSARLEEARAREAAEQAGG